MTDPHPTAPEVHPRLDELFRAFDRDRLAWCLLRGEDELDRPTGDIDILAAPADADRLQAAAARLGFSRLPAAGHASHRFLITYDPPTDIWLKLDVVSELAFGPSFADRLPSVAAGSCLDRRRTVGPAFALDPRDGFWAGLLHGLLDKARIEDDELTRLRGLAGPAREGGPLARAVATLLPADWPPERVIDAVERGDRDDLRTIKDGLGRSWRRRSPIGTTARRIESGVRRRTGRVARIQRPRGLELVLVGDPALARRLATRLDRTAPLKVRFVDRSAARSSAIGRIRSSLQVGSDLVVRSTPDAAALRRGPASPRPDQVIDLEGSRPEDELAREVARQAWERLAERWDAGGSGA